MPLLHQDEQSAESAARLLKPGTPGFHIEALRALLAAPNAHYSKDGVLDIAEYYAELELPLAAGKERDDLVTLLNQAAEQFGLLADRRVMDARKRILLGSVGW